MGRHGGWEVEAMEMSKGVTSRVLPHERLQDHFARRFYISLSRPYSCLRLLPDERGYDIPVYDDWVTIAVVAERGPIKFSKAPEQRPPKPSGKKYVNMKLIDFAVIRGDAESDGFDVEPRENGSKGRIHKGGSRGAFESMSMLKKGDVIAYSYFLYIVVFLIVHSRQLGMCTVLKCNGSVRGSWCDKCVSDVFEWHVQRHLACRAPQSRSEDASTLLRNNWEDTEGSATYVVPGHVVTGSGPSSLEVSENIDREGQAKAQRLRAKDADKAPKTLLDQDKEGMKVVIAAREYAQKEEKKRKEDGRKRQQREPQD
ncbi:hypothetical protein ARMSODRAFT_991317 [Armillaria solidipes]|uniref:Uncharacterized protein n=1 Tax=Armillaria solidipes TaxID=1076256 RepID=A0A2H3B0Y2_9AGAR|nr:hypothetical protein ARMSODRAFT_991317 [Armillaria solidipes]